MDLQGKTKEDLISELLELHRSFDALREQYDKDITLLKKAEEKFKKAYLTNPDSININRLSDGMYVSINEGFTRITGYTEEDAIGKTSLEINIWYNPDDRNNLVNVLKTKGEVKDFEARFLSKSGTIVNGLIAASLIDIGGAPHILSVIKNITAQKKAEEALAKEQFLIDTLMNNLTDYIYIKDLESRFIRINKSHAHALGLDNPEQVIGKKDNDFYSDEHVQQADEDEQTIIRTGQTMTREEKLTHHNGPDTWVSTVKMPFRDKDENIIGTFGISRDITERKQTEEAFLKLSLRQEVILTAVPDIIMEVDNNKIYTWANHAGLEFFGKDVIGKKASFYFEGEQETYEAVKPLFEGIEELFYLESWQRRYDGEKRLLAWSCQVLKDNQGNVTGALSSARDITESKQAEQDLLEGEKKYKLLITNIRDVVYSVDVVTKEFKYLSPSFERITGYTLEDIKEMGGRMPFLTKIVTEAKFTEWDNYLQQLNKEYIETDFKNETWWLCKDGSYKCLQDHWIPIYVNGELVSTDGILIDITDRKQADAEIQLKNELLQTINAEKDKFFSIIAHDLRGPLSAFLGATQILTEEIQNMTLEEITEIAVSMKESATNIYALLENLLEWSRLKRGMMDFNPEKINVKQKTTACIEILKESARKKGINILYTLPDDLEIYADSHMFETVIRNLVSNAIKFTPVGGKVSVTAHHRSDDSVEIKINDSGIGMPPELKNKLFLLNEKTRRNGTEGEPSTGLGLLLCKEFIEKHNGNIKVESEEGNGSTFSFTMRQFEKI
jgi:PAS domain S-box-containing protein